MALQFFLFFVYIFYLFIFWFSLVQLTEVQRRQKIDEDLREEGKKTFFSGYSIIHTPYVVLR